MGRPVRKYIPEEDMVDKKGFCEIIQRKSTFFKKLKAEGSIIPCAKDGKKFLYRKSDAIRIRREIITYF